MNKNIDLVVQRERERERDVDEKRESLNLSKTTNQRGTLLLNSDVALSVFSSVLFHNIRKYHFFFAFLIKFCLFFSKILLFFKYSTIMSFHSLAKVNTKKGE